MDFTLEKYKELCKTISDSNYKVLRIIDYFSRKTKRFVILRHDVDKNPQSALKIAKIEGKFGLRSTFYFRITTFDPVIVKKIRKFGHEIGYHYETLDKAKGDFKKAIGLFQQELNQLRKICDIKTICMHGNPLTKWVNSDLWKKYNFKKYGIIGDAYLSIDFSKLLYFSDTGRTWKTRFNVKDIVKSKAPEIKNTDELISLIKSKKYNFYILTHPQRWSDNIFDWTKELLFQNFKNAGKLFLKIKKR